MGLFHLKCFMSEGCQPVITKRMSVRDEEIRNGSDVIKTVESKTPASVLHKDEQLDSSP